MSTSQGRQRAALGFGGRPSGLAVAVALLVVAASAGAAQQSPVEAVRSRNLAIQRVLEEQGDSVDDATKELLKDMINGLIDFQELSTQALGRYWDERTEGEQAEFVQVFRALVRNSSVQKLNIHRADSLVYLMPEIDGEEAIVTTIAHKDRRSLEILYRMHWTGGEWQAYDVVIDGSSTMRTYRDSFYREIRATSFGAMLSRLREKLAEDQATQS